MSKYDFGGWATKYNVACSDGRTILSNAFKHCDNIQVPLVWNHSYSGPESIIGKAHLEHRDDGVYTRCEFNDTDTANNAKNLVMHGDITSLSIYANKLEQAGGRVIKGDIKEVSLVIAGANPGASIQEVLVHGDVCESEATIYNDEQDIEIFHADQEGQNGGSEEKSEEDETVADIYATLSEKQKKAVAVIIDQLTEEDEEENNEEDNKGEDEMKQNVFEQNKPGTELSHSDLMAAAIVDIKKHGSLKESVLAHAATYGIENIGELFPDAQNVTNEPTFIDRDQTWVGEFFNAVKKSPFSRLKAIYADITADEARALGYTKGNLKKEEVFPLLKRITQPTTIYKKQKLDRDDIIDITDFDVVAWMKSEMRGKLNEEIARAMLIGDGRSAASEFKVKEDCIRPIYSDAELYTIRATIAAGNPNKAKEMIKVIKKSRANYEGSGNPNLYLTEDILADMMLIEDANGRFIYETEEALARTLRVNKIITVPVMNNVSRVLDGKTRNLLAIIVNPVDYTLGADKGGAVSLFDDFDIDYNQQKFLIETRCSGALLKPKSAIVVEEVQA